MARMMDRMMVDSLQPFGFAKVTTRRDDNGEPPRDGLRTERSEIRRERERSRKNTHAGNGTRHPPTQGNDDDDVPNLKYGHCLLPLTFDTFHFQSVLGHPLLLPDGYHTYICIVLHLPKLHITFSR